MKAAKKRSLRRAREAPSGRFSGRSRRAQSIGVRVRDTTRDTRIAAERVTANSRNSRPVSPPMSSSGMNTATSERHRQHGETDLAGAGDRRLDRRIALPRCVGRCSSTTTMASSTTKPVAMISAISDRLFRLKSHRYMTAKVPISETGTARLGTWRGRCAGTGRPPGSPAPPRSAGSARPLPATRGSTGAIIHHVQLDLRPEQFLQHRQLRVDGVGGLDDVGAGLAGDDQQHRRQVVGKPALRTSSTESLTLATSPRRTAAPLSAL